jgi:peptidoglycan/LPS O-acetylase OafA/YrhL
VLTVHLKGLTGFRSLAALAVVWSHITLSLPEFGLNPHIFGTSIDGMPRGLLLAGFGVSMFFALSGFLITYLLLFEERLQPVNISSFYVRRILRIWPLYYIYLAACLLVYMIFNLEFAKSSVLFYLFFSANIALISDRLLPMLAHFWSIGVEEQFYLFYPFLFKWRSKLLSILVVLVVFLISLKLGFWFWDRKINHNLPLSILHVNRFHCMMIGGIGAMLYFENRSWFVTFCTYLPVQLFCWGIVFLVAINVFHIASILDNEIISGITTIIIIGQITRKNYILDLEHRLFEFLGKISYGIYVIHPVIIFFTSQALKGYNLNSLLGYIFIYAVITLITIIVSYLSYEYLEKRFLKFKGKYSVVASSPIQNTYKEDIKTW